MNFTLNATVPAKIDLTSDDLLDMLVDALAIEQRIDVDAPWGTSHSAVVSRYVRSTETWTETSGRLSITDEVDDEYNEHSAHHETIAITGERSVRAAKALRELYQSLHEGEDDGDKRPASIPAYSF